MSKAKVWHSKAWRKEARLNAAAGALLASLRKEMRLNAAAGALLASLKEMREAAALAVRMLVEAGLSDEYIARGHALGIEDGYGARASDAIAKAEGKR